MLKKAMWEQRFIYLMFVLWLGGGIVCVNYDLFILGATLIIWSTAFLAQAIKWTIIWNNHYKDWAKKFKELDAEFKKAMKEFEND